jgi:hypothetical protein
MKPTASTKSASVFFSGLLFAVVLFPANAATQNRGANDFSRRRMTLCDFVPEVPTQFEHGKALSRTEAQFRTELRRHVANKAFAIQKECAYDSMRLLRKLLQPAGATPGEFNHLSAVRRNPSAYVGRPIVLHGRVTDLLRSNSGEVTTNLLALDSDEILARIDVVNANNARRQFPAGGFPVRVVGFLIKTLEGNTPYFCTQQLDWLTVEANPRAFDAVRHKTRGIRQEEATAYYETLLRSRILPLTAQQQVADRVLAKRINDRWENAQLVHQQQRGQADIVSRTDQTKAQEMIRVADATKVAEQRRHESYSKDPKTFPIFADVFMNPDSYVGKPVTMTGHVRRVMKYDADVDRFGSGQLHELWLFTDDSQQNPAVVVCSDLPKGFPTDDQVVQGVTVTGYFFKLYRYAADDANRAAPMLLAHSVKWQPVTSTYAGFGSLGTLTTVIAMFLGFAFLMYLWLNNEGDRRAREALAMARTADGAVSEPRNSSIRFPSPEPLPPSSASVSRTREPMRDSLISPETLPPVQPVRREVTPRPSDLPTTSVGRTEVAPVDPLYRPIDSMRQTAERATGSVRGAVGDQASKLGSFVNRQKDKATNFVENQKDRAQDFVEDQTTRARGLVDSQTERARDFVGDQKDRARDVVDSSKDKLASIAGAAAAPFASLPRTSEPQQPPRRSERVRSNRESVDRTETVRPQTGRQIRESDIVGSQILRVLDGDSGSQTTGSQIELSTGGTLTLDNDVIRLEASSRRSGRSDNSFSQLEGLVVDHIATDQWERVYVIAGRNTFITEDFGEDGQRVLIFGDLSSLFDEEPDLTLNDYWTRTSIR